MKNALQLGSIYIFLWPSLTLTGNARTFSDVLFVGAAVFVRLFWRNFKLIIQNYSIASAAGCRKMNEISVEKRGEIIGFWLMRCNAVGRSVGAMKCLMTEFVNSWLMKWREHFIDECFRAS